jgi:hypothetical protein
MNNDEQLLNKSILPQLTTEEKAKGVVYLDHKVCSPGSLSLANQTVDIAESRYLAFVDAKPGANWTHPCRYLLIDPQSGDVRSIEADRPPVFGPLPPSWQVTWQAPDVEPWRLLPIEQET